MALRRKTQDRFEEAAFVSKVSLLPSKVVSESADLLKCVKEIHLRASHRIELHRILLHTLVLRYFICLWPNFESNFKSVLVTNTIGSLSLE